MTCPCYVNSTPEHVAVTVNNNTYNVSLGDNAVKWKDLLFTRAMSSSGAGIIFTMRELVDAAYVDYQIVDHSEQMVFIDNVAQTTNVFTVSVDGTEIQLLTALEDDAVLRVHALVKEV
jgi:hypothetical protein